MLHERKKTGANLNTNPNDSNSLQESTDRNKCELAGGRWEGTIEGRGRLTGCSMPTKDAGKACKSGEDCESVCLMDGTCYGWNQYKGCANYKGHDSAMCIE